MNPSEQTAERVHAALGAIAHEAVETKDSILAVAVARDELHDALERLKGEAGFDSVTFVTAVDRYGDTRAKSRFEVVHQLRSSTHGDRVRVRTYVDEGDESVPTCTDLWPGASFMERECWDLIGIVFDGHPNLARLMMPDGYGHHPLRKEFPHQGIEPDRLYREWDRERRKTWNPDGSGKPA